MPLLQPDTASQCVIRINQQPAPPLPAAAQSTEIPNGRCLIAGTKLYFAVCDSLVFVDAAEPQCIEVWLGDTKRALTHNVNSSPMAYALQLALSRCQLYALHAACLVEPETNHGVLIIGKSGSGKTTLALQLLQQQWKFLTDDITLLVETDKQIVAAGLRKTFYITAATIAAMQSPQLEATLRKPGKRKPDKFKLNPESVFPDSYATACRISAIYFPTLTDELVSGVAELSKQQAMTRLLNDAAWICYDVAGAKDYLHIMKQVINQSRAFALACGSNLLHQPEQVAEIFSSGVRGKLYDSP